MLRGLDNSEHLRIYDYHAPAQVDKIFEDFIPKYCNFKASKLELVDSVEPSQSKQAQQIPGLGIENLTKSQLKNKKRREVLNNVGGDKEQNENAAVPTKSVENNDYQGDNGNGGLSEKDKKIRRLRNKLASIQKIREQQAEGKSLENNQFEKLSKEQEFLEELNALMLS